MKRTLNILEQEHDRTMDEFVGFSNRINKCDNYLEKLMLATSIAMCQKELQDLDSQIESIRSECDYLTKEYERKG